MYAGRRDPPGAQATTHRRGDVVQPHEEHHLRIDSFEIGESVKRTRKKEMRYNMMKAILDLHVNACCNITPDQHACACDRSGWAAGGLS